MSFFFFSSSNQLWVIWPNNFVARSHKLWVGLRPASCVLRQHTLFAVPILCLSVVCLPNENERFWVCLVLGQVTPILFFLISNNNYWEIEKNGNFSPKGDLCSNFPKNKPKKLLGFDAVNTGGGGRGRGAPSIGHISNLLSVPRGRTRIFDIDLANGYKMRGILSCSSAKVAWGFDVVVGKKICFESHNRNWNCTTERPRHVGSLRAVEAICRKQDVLQIHPEGMKWLEVPKEIIIDTGP